MTDPNSVRSAAAVPTPETSGGPQGPVLQKPVAVPPAGAAHPQQQAQQQVQQQAQVRWSMPGLENLLSGYFAQIEIKIADSKKKARDDFTEFWVVKGLIATGTLGAGVLEAYGKGSWVPALAFIATASVMVEAIRPRGTMYRQHRKTEGELTRLLEQVRADWDIAKLKANPTLGGTDLRNTVVAILEKIAVKTGFSAHPPVPEDSNRTESASPSQAA